MPQSITIAAFVFGAVLLLIALVGGGFKIFGAEVSGKAGSAGRFLAGLAGVVLLCIGLFGSIDKAGTPTTSDAQQPASSSPSLTTSNPQPAAAPAASNKEPDAASESKSKPSDSRPPINNAAGSRDTDSQQIQAQQAPVEQDANIGGIWRDSFGSVFEVSQTGNSYTFRASGVNFVSAGRGTVRGHQLESIYETQYANGTRASGRCTGTVSADGGQTRSSCFDNINGQWESIGLR